MLACIAPENNRTTTIIHSAVAAAVTKKPSASPEKPISSTGRRPTWSDSAPSIGAPKKLATPKAKVVTPNQKVCASGDAVKVPTM
jgi:hypothetical protein